MYLGIDLGTSNSAIVGFRGGQIDLYKTVTGEDVLPSVVMRDRSGSCYVGKRAYDQLQVSPSGIAARFKRLLGTNTVLPFGEDDGTITPEEASAEVLRQLLKQVHARVGEVGIEGAVITVPAAFNQMQSEATICAASKAGLGRVGLLQEPIAAALACIERPGTKSGLFLIYDLGGGTFDGAYERDIDGSVTIEAHQGINMLGGSDFDRALVDTMIRPWLEQNFHFSDECFAKPEIKRLMALTTANAELAKIELSSAEEAIIFVSEHEARATDLAGKAIYIEMPVRREQLEALVAERIDRSVELCRKIVAGNGYQLADIDRVVLIGGPSRMPIIRRTIREQLDIEVDMDIDPMTAVARGATIYAESREWKGEQSVEKEARQQKQSGSKVSYDFEARTSRERARIRVSASGECDGLRVTAQASDGRDYGERLVSECPVFAIQLADGVTSVAMTVVDSAGQRIEDACEKLEITKVAAIAAGAPCTSTIAVKVEDSDGVRAINVLEPLVMKGDVLPRQGTKTLRAARKITPGIAEWIDVELFEQAEGVPEPEANLLVGSFRLSGEDLPAHAQPLNPGELVVLHWSVDHSQLIRCSIELPDHGLHLQDHSFYLDDMAKIDFARHGKEYATDILIATDRMLEGLPSIVAAQCPDELERLKRRVAEQFKRLERTGDADGFRSVSEEARLIGQDIVRLRSRPELHAEILRQQLDDAMSDVRRLTALMSPEDRAAIEGHHATAAHALSENRLQIARRAMEAINAVYMRILCNSPEFIISHFRHLSGQAYAARDPGHFDMLVRRGGAAAAARDIAEVRAVIGEMYSQLPSSPSVDTDVAALAGLRR